LVVVIRLCCPATRNEEKVTSRHRQDEERDGMIKTLGILVGGIFVGAAGVEVVRRKYPDALAKLYATVRKIASEARESFKRGYENATRSKEAAVASA